MDKEFWTFFNSFAPWLAGIGTVLAVIVSLYLATRDKRIRLKITADVRSVIQTGLDPQQLNDVVMVNITNVGYTSVTIQTISWELGLRKKHTFLQTPSDYPGSMSFPTKLSHGDQADLLIRLTDFEGIIAEFQDVLSGKLKNLKIRLIRLRINTSVGKIIKARLKKPLQDLIIKEYS